MPTKTHSFTLFLLKDGYNADNALDDEHGLVEDTQATDLPANSRLFILDTDGRPPWWREYLGVSVNVLQAQKGAILFLEASDRIFALTFGNVSYKLHDYSYHYDFGLRVTLNSLKPGELKSADMVEPGAARRKRTQVAISTDLTFLDFDGDSEIIKSLTGQVKDEHKGLFSRATGAASLKVGLKKNPAELVEACESILEIYESDEYQDSFPNIQKISPVRDPSEIERLNGFLAEALNGQIGDIALTIPDIIDYRDATCCVFTNGSDKSQIFPDIDLGGLYDFAAANDLDLSQLDNIKGTKVNITDVDGRPYKSHSLMRCLVYDHQDPAEGVVYHLSDGDWYKVQQDYVEEIVEYLDAKFVENDLPDYDHDIHDKGRMVYSEGAYNEAVPPHVMPAICLDQTSIAPAGNTGVEPCDIYRCVEEEGTQSGSRATFYHIKISTRSSQLSHLFNQGVNAVELVSRSSEAAERLIALVKDRGGWEDDDAPCQAIIQRDFSVIFGIITRKEAANLSANIPLFSKISLKRNLEYLSLLRVPSFYTFIPDISPEKDGHVKYETVEVVLREHEGKRGLFAIAGQNAFGAPVSTDLPIERSRADWKEEALGTRFQISVVLSKTGHLRTYHGWPYVRL